MKLVNLVKVLELVRVVKVVEVVKVVVNTRPSSACLVIKRILPWEIFPPFLFLFDLIHLIRLIVLTEKDPRSF